MDAPHFVAPSLASLDDAEADLLCLGVFEDERPLRRLGGLVDWRLAGRLSRLCKSGFLTGGSFEQVLLPGRPRLAFDKILLLGLGTRRDFDAARCAEAFRVIRQRLGELLVRRAVVELPGHGALSDDVRARAFRDTFAEALAGDLAERVTFVEEETQRRALLAQLSTTRRSRP